MENRRDFLSKGARLCAVFSMCGCGLTQCKKSPVEPPAYKPPKPKDPKSYATIAFCSIDCSTCPQKASCAGCKNPEANKSCSLQKCAYSKNVQTCAHCAEYPTCEDPMWSKWPSLRTGADKIRKYLEENNYI